MPATESRHTTRLRSLSGHSAIARAVSASQDDRVVAIDLGPLKATEGMQDFPIPADTASTVSSLVVAVVAVVAAMDGDGVAPPACEHPATTIATTRSGRRPGFEGSAASILEREATIPKS